MYSTVGVAVERFISVCIPHSQVNMLKMVMVMMIYLVSKERFIFQPVWVLPPESSVYIGEQKFKNFRDDHFKFMSLVQKWHFLKKDVGDGVYADHTDDYDQRYEQVSPRFSLHISFAIVGFSILINVSR